MNFPLYTLSANSTITDRPEIVISTFHFHLLVLPAFFVGLLVAPTSSFYISREFL